MGCFGVHPVSARPFDELRASTRADRHARPGGHGSYEKEKMAMVAARQPTLLRKAFREGPCICTAICCGQIICSAQTTCIGSTLHKAKYMLYQQCAQNVCAHLMQSKSFGRATSEYHGSTEIMGVPSRTLRFGTCRERNVENLLSCIQPVTSQRTMHELNDEVFCKHQDDCRHRLRKIQQSRKL